MWRRSALGLIAWIVLWLGAGCQLTRDYSATALGEGDAAGNVDASTDATLPPADASDVSDAADAAENHDAADAADATPMADAADAADVDGLDADADAADAGGLTGKQPCPAPTLEGNVIYVAPNGASDAAGTRQAPLDVEAAVAAAQPGDTVLFLPGSYQTHVAPSVSGTVDAPIVFRSETRHAAEMQGVGGNGVAFDFIGVSHIRVEGFDFAAGSPRWAVVLDSDHITLADNWFAGHDGVGVPLRVENSQQIRFVDNVVRRSHKWLLADFDNVSGLVLAGNSFSLSPTLPVRVKNSDRVLVRANVIHNQVGTGGQFINNEDLVYEDNILANISHGPGVSVAQAYFSGRRLIIRNNRVFRNWATPLALPLTQVGWVAERTRIYNNIIHRSRDYGVGDGVGWWFNADAGTLVDLRLENNVFTNNGAAAGHRQLSGRNLDGAFAASHNLFWADGNDPTVEVDSNSYTISEATQNLPQLFSDNIVAAPGYADAATYDLRPGAGSSMIDAGRALTTTGAAGSGKTLSVQDTYYFFDGFGLRGIRGDLIAVGDPSNIARIAEVDHAAGTLTLDRDLTWNAGDPVSLPWSDQAPDLGPTERGDTARPGVAIDASTRLASSSIPVTLEPRLRGDIDPVLYEWRLGDGTITCGRSFEHSYTEQGDYPVRLTVTDRDGTTYRAAAYILVDIAADSFDYNIQLMDDYMCDGTSRGYTDDVAGRDNVSGNAESGYDCVQ